MKKGFSIFLVKIIIIWVVIVGLLIMMLASPQNEKVVGTATEEIISQDTNLQEDVSYQSTTNPLEMIGILFGIGVLITVINIFSSRCPKCGQWFAMGKTIAERVQIGVRSTTKGKTRNKFGLGALLALFDWRWWWLGLRSGGKNYNSTTDSKAIYGLKKTRFCLECGYEKIKMPK
jgi:hypothetical protein